MSDLSSKVRAIAFEETPTGHRWAYEHLTSEPSEDLSQREEDLREWGYAFGLAYGIARGEDPYEANGSVAERAYMAATALFHDPAYSALTQIKRFEAPAADLVGGKS